MLHTIITVQQPFWQAVIAPIIYTIILGALGLLWRKFDKFFTEQRCRMQNIEYANMVVLQDRLDYLCDRYIEAGEVSLENMKSIINMFKAYEDLKGNDWIHQKVELVKKLPIKRKK